METRNLNCIYDLEWRALRHRGVQDLSRELGMECNWLGWIAWSIARLIMKYHTLLSTCASTLLSSSQQKPSYRSSGLHFQTSCGRPFSRTPHHPLRANLDSCSRPP